MSQLLRSRSADLMKLQEDGFDIVVRGARLIVRQVPYVNSAGEVRWGTLACTLATDGEATTQPTDHSVMFAGEVPYDQNGTSLQDRLIAGTLNESVGDIAFTFTLSRMPDRGHYLDFYEKIATYCGFLCPAAQAKDATATPYRFDPVTTEDDAEEVFQYLDTNSARGNIVNINELFRGLKIGIIGLGGTGSYVLDLVSKCQVGEIRLHDGDTFKDHNAFRAPGAASVDSIKQKLPKVEYLGRIYSNQHKHIKPFPAYVDEHNVQELADLDFVFLCIDACPQKKVIVDFLVQAKIPFIDSGVGLDRRSNRLAGQVRTTLVSESTPDRIFSRIPLSDDDDGEYGTNVQVADINALAATIAVIRWKRHLGFYDDLESEFQSIYVVDGNAMINNGGQYAAD